MFFDFNSPVGFSYGALALWIWFGFGEILRVAGLFCWIGFPHCSQDSRMNLVAFVGGCQKEMLKPPTAAHAHTPHIDLCARCFLYDGNCFEGFDRQKLALCWARHSLAHKKHLAKLAVDPAYLSSKGPGPCPKPHMRI